MTIRTIPSGGEHPPAGFTADIKKRLDDFMTLDSSLQKGMLSDAQSALTSLQKGFKETRAFDREPKLTDDLDSIQTSLYVGDIAGARRDFETLKLHLRRARPQDEKNRREENAADKPDQKSTGAAQPLQQPSSGVVVDRLM